MRTIKPSILIVILCCIVFIWFAMNKYRHLMRIPATTLGATLSSEVPISRWTIIGPFKINAKSLSAEDDNKDIGLNHDYLASYGVHEASIDDSSFLTLSLRILWMRFIGLFHGEIKTPEIVPWVSKSWFVDLEKVLDDPKMVVSYAIAKLDVTQERRVAIMAGSADGMKCWLNKELIVTSAVDEIRDLEPYASIAAVNLHRGSNIIVCKVDRLVMSEDPGWAYRVAITDMQNANKELENKIYRAFDSTIFRPGSEIRPLYDFFDAPTKGELILTDLNGTLRFREEYMTNSHATIRVPNLSPGVYRCTLRVGDAHYENDIYVGYPEKIQLLLDQQVKTFHGKSKNLDDYLAAWLYRVNHLMLPEHYKPQDARWQFKVINAAKDIQGVIQSHDDELRNVIDSPGYHILSYRSHIDNSIQYYGIHVPSKIRSKSLLPLILNLDGVEETSRPFLEGTRVSDIDDEVERLNAYSNRYGMLIADPFGRGNSRGAPIQETDFMEVLANIGKSYAIDRAQIYLMGMCEGGREAIALAEHFPSIFAAVSADIPTGYSEGPAQAPSEEWMRNHDIVQMAHNLRHIPVMVQHGDHNDHIPLKSSQDFVRDCKQSSGECELQILTDSYARYSQIDRTEHMIQFLLNKTGRKTTVWKDLTPSEIKYGQAEWMGDWFLQDSKSKKNTPHDAPQENPRGECVNRKTPFTSGPIADIFTGPVLLVTGTRGPITQQRYAKRIATEIEEAWDKNFFTVLPQSEDRQLTYKQLKNSNLIIIGAENVNSAWSRLKGLPVASSKEIIVGGRKFSDPDLVMEAVFPNPFNREKYVVLVSTNSRGEWKIRDAELWLSEGSYDYSVYSATDPSDLIERGIFDTCWKREVDHVQTK